MAGYSGWKQDKEIDWDKVSTDAPTPLEDGIYKAEIVEADPRESSKGDPSARLLLEVTEDYDGEEVNRRKVFDNITFTEAAAFKAKQLCEAIDVDPPARTGFKYVKEFCAELVGMEVWVKLNTQTYQGKKNNKVDVYINEEDLKEVAEGLEASDDEEEEEKPRGRKKKAPASKSNGAAKKKRGAAAAAETEDLSDDDGDDEAEDDDDEEEAPPPRAKSKRGRPARAARGRSARS